MVEAFRKWPRRSGGGQAGLVVVGALRSEWSASRWVAALPAIVPPEPRRPDGVTTGMSLLTKGVGFSVCERFELVSLRVSPACGRWG